MPNLAIIQHDSEWLPMIPATPIQPREISSNTTASETMSAAMPPYSSGTSRPNSPICRIVATISSGYLPDSSHSLATGRISRVDERPDRVAEQPLLVRQLEVHAGLLRYPCAEVAAR